MASPANTVLVVDDEDVLMPSICGALTRAGFHVLSANSGPNALSRCREYQGQIHLAVIDIVMPGMTGPELRDRLNEEFPEIRVLFMTGFTPDAILSSGISIGATGLLLKPFRSAELIARVQAELEKPASTDGS